jgi:hypothetical protein
LPRHHFFERSQKDQQWQGTNVNTMKAKVSLGLAKLSIPSKIEKSRHITKSMGGSPFFTNPLPTLAEVTTDTDELEAAANAAKGGGPALTALMYDKEDMLDSALTRLGNYVESIANGNDAIILAAGMEVRSKGARPANQFTVTNGEHEGEAVLQTPATARASYIWQKSTDPFPADQPIASSSKWEQIGVTTVATLTTNSLMSGLKYWFRVAVVTSTGQGLWSDPVSLRVQ